MTQPTPSRASRALCCLALALLLGAALGVPARAVTPAVTPAEGAPAGAAPALNPADLDDRTIDAAIAKGVQAIYANEPRYTIQPEYVYNAYYGAEYRNAVGNQALAIWALLATGETYQNPKLYRRLNWVLSSDIGLTYDRAMRETMLGELPHERWFPWVRRDGIWLSGALSNEGNFADSWNGPNAATGMGDNANGQYGVLGLWAAQRSGYQVDSKTWQKIDKYWRDAQEKTEADKPAGWGVFSFGNPPKEAATNSFYKRISGPMTAGGVATLCLTERYLAGPTRLDPNQDNVSPNLHKGVRWLDENFSLDDKDEAADRYYYYWTIQRVGEATGYRTFHGIDWFRDVTARVLSEQQPDGSWHGDKGPLLSTGFALLYLSRASNEPAVVGKVRFKAKRDGHEVDNAWNNRPNDIWNFADYASQAYVIPTTWQIVQLTEPVYALIETPMLYMATNGAPVLSDKEVDNLRAYVDAGGLLVTNSDGGGEATHAFHELATRLFPNLPLKRVTKGQPFYDLYAVHQRLNFNTQFEVVYNGLRPLMVHFIQDIGKGLQTNDVVRGEGFVGLSNLYLYVTGMNPRRGRLESYYVAKKNVHPTRALAAARIKHGGNFDPEPGALTQLQAILANRYDVDLQVSTVAPAELSQQKIAFLTTEGDAKLTDEEAAAIRRWVEAGGTLWLDAAGGSAAAQKSATELYSKIVPNIVPVPLSTDNPILTGDGLAGGYDNRHVKFRVFSLREMGPTNTPRIQAAQLNDRPAVVLSTDDLTCGLAGLDHWGIFGYTPEFSRQIVINGVLMAMNNPAPNAATATTFAAAAAARNAATPAQTQPAGK